MSIHSIDNMGALPNLPEEVWRNIFTILRHRPPSPEETDTKSEFPQGQRDLARVLRVNSVFYEVAAPLLYESVVTQNLPALLYGAASCDIQGYMAEFRSLVGRRRAAEKQLRWCRGPIPLAGRDDESTVLEVVPDRAEQVAVLEEVITELLCKIKNLHESRPDIRAHDTSADSDGSRLDRISKADLLSRMSRLQIGCPEVIMGSGPMSVSRSTLDDAPFIGPRMLARLEFYVGLYQALTYLARSTSMGLDKLEHVHLGWTSRRWHSGWSPEVFFDHSREIECSTAWWSVYDSVTHALSAFFDTARPRQVCLSGPLGFIRLGTPERPFRVFWQPKIDPKNIGSPILTLHNFLTYSERFFFTDIDCLAGKRIRYCVPVCPSGHDLLMMEPTTHQIAVFDSALHATGELSTLPEWSSSDVEIVIGPTDRVQFGKAVDEALASFHWIPYGDLRVWEAAIREKTQEALALFRAALGNPSWDTRVRILTDVSQSPWGQCACGRGW